eukprot:gnl/Dysnectes_brevis/5173_a7325_495.p1 GENE.gnl/Dysnectes_brevis/5173_a7325_495~~gnl/Dysnectes_brevis/5173_a7325_495.p1  ORF type:complete len:286 (+),score=-20.57 gnl/Dysnectes_brevis/5173_a7325_495:46-903(+)
MSASNPTDVVLIIPGKKIRRSATQRLFQTFRSHSSVKLHIVDIAKFSESFLDIPQNSVIIHKPSTLFADDITSRETLDFYTRTLSLLSPKLVIDPLSCITHFTSRTALNSLLSPTLPIPSQLPYPIIIKPDSAKGHPSDHHILVVQQPPHPMPSYPHVTSAYIPHVALIKANCMGGNLVGVSIYGSLDPIIPKGTRIFEFDTPNLKLPFLDPEDKNYPDLDSLKVKLKTITDEVYRILKSQLFGIDLLLDYHGSLWIVDVNYFPSFKHVPFFGERLIAMALASDK